VDATAEHVTLVVYLSTDVADLADGEQATSFHQENGRLIGRSGLSWTFLRAIDFAANTLAWADQVREGVVRLPYWQASRSLIHEHDVADVAVHVLTPTAMPARNTCSRPESITHAELVGIIGEAIGEEVRCQDAAPGPRASALPAPSSRWSAGRRAPSAHGPGSTPTTSGRRHSCRSSDLHFPRRRHVRGSRPVRS